MQKNFILKILLVIGFCSEACANDVEFNDFLNSYLNNPGVALTRTILPLRHVTEYAGDSASEAVIKEITIEEFKKWPLVTGKKVADWERWEVISIDEAPSCEYVSCKYVIYGIPYTGISSRFLFVKKEELWFLLEMHEVSF